MDTSDERFRSVLRIWLPPRNGWVEKERSWFIPGGGSILIQRVVRPCGHCIGDCKLDDASRSLNAKEVDQCTVPLS